MASSIWTVTVPATVRRLALQADFQAEVGATAEPAISAANRALDDACADVERYCQTIFARETLSEVFRQGAGQAASSLGLARRPLVSITSIVEDGVTLAPADYEFDATEQRLYRLVDDERADWTARKITVVYLAGYLLPGQDGANLPADITRATLIAAAAIYAARGRDGRVRSESADGVGAVSYLDPRRGDGGLPPDVADRLRDYQRYRVRI